MKNVSRFAPLLLLLGSAACDKAATAAPAPAASAASAPRPQRKPVRADAQRTTATCTSRSGCERDCATQAVGSCAKLASMREPLRGDAANMKAAFELVRASCENAGDAKACDALAGYIEAGIVLARDEARARALWAEAAAAFVSACDHGDHQACRDAEDLYRKGRGVARDEATFTRLHKKAVALYQKACPAGDLDACDELASEYRLAREDGADPRAEALQKKLCDGGRDDACISLARGLPDGKAREALEQRAFASRRARCETEKDGRACFLIGSELDNRLHAPKFRKPEAATEWFRKGCELGDQAACLSASTNLASLGKNDEALAFRKRYLDMAEGLCAVPVPVACANLGYALEGGGELPADRARAKQLYDKACASGGVVGACEHARNL